MAGPDFDDPDDKYPEPGAVDRFAAFGRAVVASIPGLGPAAAELLGQAIGPVIERQRVEWLNDLAAEVRRLKKSGRVTEDDLRSPEFAAAVAAGVRAAMVAASKEKRDLLRNAALNVLLRKGPPSDFQEMYWRFAEDLTPTHIQLLRLLSLPVSSLNPTGIQGAGAERSPLSSLFEGHVPELAKNPDAPGADRFLSDLIDRELVAREPIRSSAGKDERPVKQPRWNFKITPFGKGFLAFLAEPPEAK